MGESDAMEIVQLAPADYDRVVDLWRRAGLSIRPRGRDSRQAFAGQLASGVQTVLALEDKGELVGVVVATHDSRKGWINRLAVEPAFRRQGIGLRLIAAAEEHLRGQGIQIITTLIEGWNTASIAIFTQAGYTQHPDIVYFSKRSSPDV